MPTERMAANGRGMNEFSSQEINQLIEALLCWEKEPGNREVQNSMFSMMFAGLGAKTEEESGAAVEKARLKSEREQDRAKLW